jgi:hypothetical protein
MAASRATASALGGVLGDFTARGVAPTLRALGLTELIGQPLTDVLLGVLERVCPPGSTVDDAIAREAYLQALIECTAAEGSQVPFTEELAIQLIESYAANSICLQIANDVGTKALDVAPSVSTALHVEEQLREYVEGAVRDAVQAARSDGVPLDRIEAGRIASEIYPSAWEMLRVLNDDEGGDE